MIRLVCVRCAVTYFTVDTTQRRGLVHYLSWLEPVIGTRLAAGTIGPVVFVRANLEFTADHGLLVRVAAAGLEGVARWVGAEVKNVYSQGGVKAGYVSVTVEFANGASALVSAEAAHGEPAMQLLIVGRNGTIRYDDFPAPEQLRETPVASEGSVRWIEESLRAGVPVARRRN